MKKLLKFLCVVMVLGMVASPSFGMTEDQRTKCHWIIHSAATAAAASAAALAQAPGTDNAVFVGIMSTMTASLAFVFDIDTGVLKTYGLAFDNFVMTIMAKAGGLLMSRTISQWCVGWIPFIGNAVNSASMAAMVELIDWKIAKAFDNNEYASMGLIKGTLRKAADTIVGEDVIDTVLEYTDGLIGNNK